MTSPKPSAKNLQTTTHPASSLILALDLMRAEGFDAEACLKGTGLGAEALADERRAITLPQEIVFYRNLLRLTGDPCLGLRIGRTYLLQYYGLFGYALLSAATVSQALAIATEFGGQLTFTWFRMGYSLTEDKVRFEFRDDIALDSDVRAMYFDRDCAAFHASATQMLRRPLELTRVFLPHDGHGCRQAYEAHFACPVTFNHPCGIVEFARSVLKQPLPFGDEEAAKRLAQQCALLLSKLQRRGGLVEKVRALLIGQPGRFPDIEWVADKLQVSVRTLRRRLQEENSSYQAILDEVRFGLAREYLVETALPLHEISALLGFSEPGNFTHAFKRWSGLTPKDFRRREGITLG